MFQRLKEQAANLTLAAWRRITFSDPASDNKPEEGAPACKTEDSDLPPLQTDTRPALRFGMIALVIGVGGFFLWSSLAPLDEGVPATGTVVVESKRKTVQHLRGGIIEEIKVREGDTVKAGDVLLRLNDTESRAQLDIAYAQLWSAWATYSRLIAEHRQQERLAFPGDLYKHQDDPRAREAMQLQTQLFQTRRATLTSEIGILEENIKGLQEQVNGLESVQAGKKRQIELISEELNAFRGLAKEGFVPQVKVLELERLLADLTGSRGDDLANISRTRNAIAETKLRILQRRQAFMQEVETQLSDVQKEVASLKDRIKALEDEVIRAVVRAPTEGQVVGLEIHTLGGVIRGGDRIMDIVPQTDQLVIEAQVLPHLIDKVLIGMPADIRLSTITASTTTPVIEGTLITISADRLTDQRSGQPYYLGRIEVTKEGLLELARHHVQLQPGMPADVIFKSGERTLLDYLVRPLMNRIAGSMKEI